jgi:hypothetical protein|tara:strand:- start:252 stop:503 length:252 start_codon:yes stop_codon:yes gene_type:complete
MPKYRSVARTNLFKNTDRFENGQPLQKGAPPWSNGKFQIDEPLQPGVYKIAAWQYLDTGNISIDIQTVEDDSPETATGGFDVG